MRFVFFYQRPNQSALLPNSHVAQYSLMVFGIKFIGMSQRTKPLQILQFNLEPNEEDINHRMRVNSKSNHTFFPEDNTWSIVHIK
jgi:hypothetical protein